MNGDRRLLREPKNKEKSRVPAVDPTPRKRVKRALSR
jgi:hypothetical protein